MYFKKAKGFPVWIPTLAKSNYKVDWKIISEVRVGGTVFTKDSDQNELHDALEKEKLWEALGGEEL